MSGVAGFAVIILLVRYMDVHNYAGYTALNGLTMLCGIVAGLGLERAISRYVPEAVIHHTAHELGRFIWVISLIRFFVATLVSLLIVACWAYLIRLFGVVELQKFPLPLAFFIIAETLFQHFSAVLQALVMQKILTRIMVVQWAGRLALLTPLIVAHSSISLEHALWVMAIPELIGVVVFILVIRQHLKHLNTDQTSAKEGTDAWPPWKGVIKLAAHNYGFNLLAAPPQGYFMKMMVAIFLPAHMVAAYGFFLSVAERMRQYIPLHLFYNLIEPLMIAKYIQDKDFQSLNYRCQLLYKTNLLLLIPALALVAAAGSYVISMMTGGKYYEYVWILCVVIIQLTIGSHVVLLQLILNSVGASFLLIRASVYGLIVMGIFSGLIISLNSTYIVLAPITFSLSCNIYIVRQLSKLGYPYHISWRMLAPIMASGVVAFVVIFLALLVSPKTSNNLLMSVMSGLGIMFAYIPAIWLMKAISKDEVSMIKSLLSSKRQ